MTTRDLLVPTWIAGFGFLSLNAPPLGVAASLSAFVGGVILVPMLIMLGTSLVPVVPVVPPTCA